MPSQPPNSPDSSDADSLSAPPPPPAPPALWGTPPPPPAPPVRSTAAEAADAQATADGGRAEQDAASPAADAERAAPPGANADDVAPAEDAPLFVPNAEDLPPAPAEAPAFGDDTWAQAPATVPAARYPEPYAAFAKPHRRSRKPLVVGAIAATLALGGGVLAVASGGGEDASAAGTLVSQTAPDVEGIPDDNQGLGELPKARPKLVQPVAGETSVESATAGLETAPADDGSTPKVTGPASSSKRSEVMGDPGVSGLKANTATALPNGVALPPLDAPEAVLDVIRAGNIIARSPYKWGGGHGNFQDNGYDCSGSVTYALYFAGLIDGSHTSGELMAYGKPGPGKWITIYTNPGHVYMEVAGIRFDTSGARDTGSRWQNDLRDNVGYEVRHPAGF